MLDLLIPTVGLAIVENIRWFIATCGKYSRKAAKAPSVSVWKISKFLKWLKLLRSLGRRKKNRCTKVNNMSSSLNGTEKALSVSLVLHVYYFNNKATDFVDTRPRKVVWKVYCTTSQKFLYSVRNLSAIM